ncbi:MAG: alpha/beta fold hydrolase [Armatimonadetes bacterium]|nr:alpha/beta fold hydrolase [Armatimonadota bacterium]
MTTDPTTYDLAGPEDAPPLVFLHAASYTRKVWLPQTRALRQDFRVLALDLPAHGALADRPFTFAAAVREVAQVLHDVLPGRRALLVGTSLGGCVAMQFAAAHPGRVAGLVLSGCTFDARGLLCRLVLTGEGIVFPRGAQSFTRALHRDLHRRFPDLADEIIAAGTYWHGAAQAVRAMRRVDFRSALARYPGPALILNGRHDRVHRSSEAAFAGAAQNARVLTIARAGHIASLDQPGAFTDAVRYFASQVFAAVPSCSPRIGGRGVILKGNPTHA